MASASPLITWASRGAGVVGLVSSVLYISIVLGQGDPSLVPLALVYFAFMAGGGFVALFADRAAQRTARRLMWPAFAVFFVLGVLSILTIGVLFLIAAVLAIFSLSRGAPIKKAGSGGGPGSE